MPTLHDPYANADHIRWAVAFLVLVALMVFYSYIIVKVPQIWKLRAISSAMNFLIAFTASLLFTMIPLPLQSLKPFVKAPAYQLPSGCEERYYRLMDSISRYCGVKKYEIGNYREYGLSSNAGKTMEDGYFRLENDVVQIRCDSANDRQSVCEVASIRRGFYYQ